MEPEKDRPVRLGDAPEPDRTASTTPRAARDPIAGERVWRLTYEQSVWLMEVLNAEPRTIEALREAHARLRELVAD